MSNDRQTTFWEASWREWNTRRAVQDGILRVFMEAGHIDRLEDIPAWEDVVPPRVKEKVADDEGVTKSDHHPPPRWGVTDDGHRVKVGVKLTGQDPFGWATVKVEGPEGNPLDEHDPAEGPLKEEDLIDPPEGWLDELLALLETVEGVTRVRNRTGWWGDACVSGEAVNRWVEEAGP